RAATHTHTAGGRGTSAPMEAGGPRPTIEERRTMVHGRIRLPAAAGLFIVCAAHTASAQLTRYALTDLGPGRALGVNNAGQVVGSRNGQAVMWDHGQVTVLWGAAGENNEARRINDLRQIVVVRLQGRCQPDPCFPTLVIWENGGPIDIPARFGIDPPVVFAA